MSPDTRALTTGETPAPKSGTAATTRTCPVCWDTFTTPPRNPRKTYCTDRCRATANRRRRRDEPPPTDSPTPSPRTEDLPQPAAHRDCPHCGGPVTIVALLTTPEAARPTMPATAPSGGVIPLHR